MTRSEMVKRIIKVIILGVFLFCICLGAEDTNKMNVSYAKSNTDSNELSSKINVMDFGATGTGLTDDFEAVYAAIQKASEENKVLYFPNGIYYISAPIAFVEDIEIEGESRDASFVLFKNSPSPMKEYKWLNRGLLTFNTKKLSIRNITFAYSAGTSTPYTRQSNEKDASEGVVLSVLSSEETTLDNCRIMVAGNIPTSVTCAWFKAESQDISNVTINNCRFENYSTSTVGGGLWFSCNDSDKYSLENIVVKNSYFLKGNNDEALSFFGHGNITNVSVKGNEFVFMDKGLTNYSFITFGLENGFETYTNTVFEDNTIKINGDVRRVIKCEDLGGDSNIIIRNNRISCEFTGKDVHLCYHIKNGKATIQNNTINAKGSNVVAYLGYDKGGEVTMEQENVSVQATRVMLINSGNSVYFPNAKVEMRNNTYNIKASNTVAGQSVIQYPDSGMFTMQECSIDMSGSALKELKVQLLESTDKTKNTSILNFQDNSTDCKFIFSMNNEGARKFYFIGNTCDSLNLVIKRSGLFLDEVRLSNNQWNRFLINYKDVTAADVAAYSVKLAEM